MSSQNFKIVKSCINFVLFLAASSVQVTVHAWEVDLSRRQTALPNSGTVGTVVDSPSSVKTEGLLQNYMESSEPTQEVVIMSTEKGFVPETVRLKKGSNYRIHVVNVNESEHNTSFILDAFSEHHATFFGQDKSFSISPKTEGVFSFQCPETAKQGKIVIISNESRKPASAD